MFKPFLLCAALLCALPAAAETVSRTLPNGMKVIVREDQRAPVAVSQLWFRVGSVDENPGKTGLSHALEHMMFKGTHSVPAGEFSRRVSAWGGNDNAFTSRNETVYHETLAVANLPQVLALEADRMANLNFSDADFDNEMKVIREERRMRSDNSPTGKMWETLYLTAFGNPANRAPVIGYMDDLHTLKADDLRQWYRRWYAPANATLVVVGDVKANELLDTAEKLFAPLPARALPERKDLAETAPAEHRRATTSAPGDLPLVSLAFHAPSLRRLDDRLPYALSMLSAVLDGHSASRLDKHLVRGRKVAVSVGLSYELLSRSPDLFVFTGYPAPGFQPEDLTQAFLDELKKIAEQGVGEAELARIRNQLDASEQFAKDDMESQAEIIGYLESAGFSYTDEAEIRRREKAVTAAEVQEAARWLLTQKHTTVILLPEAVPGAEQLENKGGGS